MYSWQVIFWQIHGSLGNIRILLSNLSEINKTMFLGLAIW